jgi:hypothetical protein
MRRIEFNTHKISTNSNSNNNNNNNNNNNIIMIQLQLLLNYTIYKGCLSIKIFHYFFKHHFS